MRRMRLFIKKSKILKTVVFLIVIIFVFFIFLKKNKNREIAVFNQLTKELYFEKKVKTGDILSFEWEHSFEHICWKEFYKITDEKNFELFTIAVEGFGAGIPAEMDCTYRFEDGMIYMENIKGSIFKEFNWINSQNQLKKIKINDIEFLKGKDLPEREKIKLLLK